VCEEQVLRVCLALGGATAPVMSEILRCIVCVCAREGEQARVWLRYYNTLQHTAIHCRTLQHTTTHCNTPQYTATHCKNEYWRRYCNTLPHTATHCNTLQHTAAHCNTPQNTARASTGGATATHCNTLHERSTAKINSFNITCKNQPVRYQLRKSTHSMSLQDHLIQYQQCAAVCCSVLQCVAVCCIQCHFKIKSFNINSVLHCVAV